MILKFHEPVDGAVPDPADGDKEWCLFEFRNDTIVDEGRQPLLLAGKSVFLIGTDPTVCDFVINEDPEMLEQHCTSELTESIAGQHCVIQFREVFKERQLSQEEMVKRGDFQTVVQERIVKPFLMDLESKGKTHMNGECVEPAKYYELLEKDVLRFGLDVSREFVVMCR